MGPIMEVLQNLIGNTHDCTHAGNTMHVRVYDDVESEHFISVSISREYV